MKVNKLNDSPLAKFLEIYKNVKIKKSNQLFDIEPEFKLLLEKKCPICGNKLVALRSKPLLICSGKRHPDRKSYIITLPKMAQILARRK